MCSRILTCPPLHHASLSSGASLATLSSPSILENQELVWFVLKMGKVTSPSRFSSRLQSPTGFGEVRTWVLVYSVTGFSGPRVLPSMFWRTHSWVPSFKITGCSSYILYLPPYLTCMYHSDLVFTSAVLVGFWKGTILWWSYPKPELGCQRRCLYTWRCCSLWLQILEEVKIPELGFSNFWRLSLI